MIAAEALACSCPKFRPYKVAATLPLFAPFGGFAMVMTGESNENPFNLVESTELMVTWTVVCLPTPAFGLQIMLVSEIQMFVPHSVKPSLAVGVASDMPMLWP